jgi:hypothetical protein
MKSKLKILAVFAVMFTASFIPESNHQLFGDWRCKGNTIESSGDDTVIIGCKYEGYNEHGSTWHWGTRHWIWLAAGLTFSIWTVVDVISKELNK